MRFLQKSFLALGLLIASVYNVQAQCNPDRTKPEFLSCNNSFGYTIHSQTTCQPSSYWPIPTDYTDNCREITNNFTSFFQYSNWNQFTTGNGTAQFTQFGTDSMRIRGTVGGTPGSNSSANICYRFGCFYNFKFKWVARKTGPGLNFNGDHAYYVLNGNAVQLTSNIGTVDSGILNLLISSGDEFCFRVNSNNIGAQTLLTISNASFDNLQLAQIQGPHPDSYPGAGDGDPIAPGAHEIVYQITDCFGNTATCSFTVTATDPPPAIICPFDIEIDLDTFDCTRVLCYNVEVANNCVNSDLVIPGFTFLGVHDGNTYYISPPGLVNHRTWEQANLIAAQLGGHLVTIKDAAENTFLTNNIPFVLAPLDNQYWLGLRYFPSANFFRWTTCEPFEYTNWGPLQPGFIDGNFVFFWDLLAGTWYDFPNLLDRRYIVEFEGGLQVQLISGIPAGNPYPPGITTNVYQVTDATGQTATCSFEVNVISSTSLQCKDINLSLDRDCTADVTPKSVLTGTYNCYDVFKIDLTSYGVPIPNPVQPNMVGKKIIATVTDTTTHNSCWSQVTIEDKLAPILLCENDTMSCQSYFIHGGRLDVIEECSNYEITLLDEFIQTTPCDTDFIKKVTQVWSAEDSWGNVSEPCTREIWIERIQKDKILFPKDKSISCADVTYDIDGRPDPLQTGVPTLFGETIYPIRDLFCNYYVDFEDIDYGEINCDRRILRTWRIREWWCNKEEMFTWPQYIYILDDRGPVITKHPYDLEATTQHRSCFARVTVPKIEAYDVCHSIRRIDLVYPGGILTNTNGGDIELPIGENNIQYRLYDECYNETLYDFIITVRDETAPVAICDRTTVVSLNHSGFNWVPADVFDDGSFDECHLHHFEVRRMDDNTCGTVGPDDWGPEVGFCCEDVDERVMVGFKAIDGSGNESICMINVEVQDKDIPLISCPPNITVDCRYPIDLNHLEIFGKVATDESLREKIIIDPKYWHYINGHPLDGIASDNCPPVVTEEIDASGMNQCGMGVILRYFTATDNEGNTATCPLPQVISIQNHIPFDYHSIQWPQDLDTFGICDPNLLIPELLPKPYDVPVTNDDICSLLGTSYTDHIFSQTVPGDPCFKIFRVWKVINWCEENSPGIFTIYEDTQVIKSINVNPPFFTQICRDTAICSYDVNCKPIAVTLSVEGGDDCTLTEELLYTVKIDYDSDGTIDFQRSEINGNVLTGTWPLGNHIVKWEIEDRCGNSVKCQSELKLLNCKSPIAYCIRDVSVGLVGMDLDGDGVPEVKMATVWASDVDAGSKHGCGYDVFLSFDKDTSIRSLTFDCSTRGVNEVSLWVTDENQNTSICKTYVIVWDDTTQLPKCPNNFKNVIVNGLISTSLGEKVQHVNVELTKSTMPVVSTNFEGEYAFAPMQAGGNYELRPSKNDDWLNGVSTADIVKIQKHILGVETFTSAYQMIAADINNTKTVTAKDISDLRKLILGITTEIPTNTSWRFVEDFYNFKNVEDALSENFPETSDIGLLNKDLTLNFKGVKVGDLNNSAITRGANYSQKRSDHSLELNTENVRLEKDKSYTIPFSSANISLYEGMQFTLKFNPDKIEIEALDGNASVNFGDQNYSLHSTKKGIITVSWNGHATNDQPLFNLRIKSKVTANLQEVLQLNSELTPAMAYGLQGQDEGNVVLSFEGGSSNDFVLYQNEPNPWTDKTIIGVQLPQSGEAKLTIYDATGKVYFKELKAMNKGFNEWHLEKGFLKHSGVFYYQVDFNSSSVTKKMVVIE